MQRAIDETDRRRTKQVAHNLEHGITPKGIKKRVTDILDGARIPGAKVGKRKAASGASADFLTPELKGKDVWLQVAELEKQMFDAAKNLEFEKAGALRDAIHKLKEGGV